MAQSLGEPVQGRQGRLPNIRRITNSLGVIESDNNVRILYSLPTEEELEIFEEIMAGRFREVEETRCWSEQPPEKYICHLCFRTGHYIQDCTFAQLRVIGHTPYQGKKQCIGCFKCPKCYRKWQSRASRANNPENCRKCNVEVYPHKQFQTDSLQEIEMIHLDLGPVKSCSECNFMVDIINPPEHHTNRC